MKRKTNEEKEAFYTKCAEIIGIHHDFHAPCRRTRWTNRISGNGRFPGFGLVQCFSSTIRVITKRGTRMFKEYDQVYEYLRELKQES